MTSTNNESRLFIGENGVVSLAIEEDYEIDLPMRLFVKSGNDLKLEIKYPNLDRLDSSILGEKNYLKTVYLNTPVDRSHSRSLCESLLGLYPNFAYDSLKKTYKESLLGLYPNFAYDSLKKTYKIVVQGFVPNKPLSKQHQLKIGDLIVSINDTEVNADNIERVLASIIYPQRIKIVALSPITYLNLNTDEHVLRSLNKTTGTAKRVVVASKSTNVVKGDRVKFSEQSQFIDECLIYAMILYFDGEAVKKKANNNNSNNNEKNGLVYAFPRNDMQISLKKSPSNELMFGLFEAIRGLFVALSHAIKDINKQDEAVCCSIQYQQEKYYVSFLHKNYGKQGILVLITPSHSVDLDYFKVVSLNLNQTVRFTFGANITRMINRLQDLNEAQHQDTEEEIAKLKTQLDEFFAKLNRRLLESTYFELFDNPLDDAKQHLVTPNSQLSFLNRLNVYREMRTKFLNSFPYYELPFNIKTDLDSALVNLEAQEFVDDLERASFKTRRLFTVAGSCLFYKDYLISTHLNTTTTRNIYEFCLHFQLFNLTKNGNSNIFHIWREVFLGQSPLRHFMIVVVLREFLLGVILESGGSMTREFDINKQIEPDPFFIQQATFVLSDLLDSGLMNAINKQFALFGSQIIFNLNRYACVLKSQPSKTLIKTKSNSRSPIRLNPSEHHRKDRSASAESRRPLSSSNRTPSSSQQPPQIIDRTESQTNEYFSRKVSRYDSLGDLTEFSKKFVNIDASFKYLPDLSLSDSIIYFASTEANTNGILFSQKTYDLNSNLFTRVFYHFVKSCFSIKKFFEHSKQFRFNSGEKNQQSNHDLIEQGVLFSLLIDNEPPQNKPPTLDPKSDPKPVDRRNFKEMSFWVVGRRKLRRTDPKSEWRNQGDFFICFHDSLDQVLVELAFDIGFSKLAL